MPEKPHISPCLKHADSNVQSITYTFDKASNITATTNTAITLANGLGNVYYNTYAYDSLYRLTLATGTWGVNDYLDYRNVMQYARNGRIINKTVSATILEDGNTSTVEYNNNYSYSNTSRPDLLTYVGDKFFAWDAAGNLTFAGTNRPRRGRNLTWTEDNRLIKVTEDLDPQYHSFYRYDAGGERTYKLVYRHKDSRPPYVFHGATMYPSPFLVITPEGYTKHYYAGTERIAAQIGKGKFNNVNSSIANADSTAAKLTAVNGIAPYLASYATPKFTYLNTLPALSSTAKEKYNTHTDHLGSSAWITDSLGVAVQHLAYLPWGETFVSQKTGNFSTIYTFSGKERDEETGYSYFGQRFYDNQLAIWLSVDPMRQKYPQFSPFVYCANNPIKLVDPNGMEIDESEWKYNKTTGLLTKLSEKGDSEHQTVFMMEGNHPESYLETVDFDGTIEEMFDSSVFSKRIDGIIDGSLTVLNAFEEVQTAFEAIEAPPIAATIMLFAGYDISSGCKQISLAINGKNENHSLQDISINMSKSLLGLLWDGGQSKGKKSGFKNSKFNLLNFAVSAYWEYKSYNNLMYPRYKGKPSNSITHTNKKPNIYEILQKK